jgi:hypothetical protein
MLNYKSIGPTKIGVFAVLILSIILSACAPSQEISRTWVNREALPKVPYKSIFVIALVQQKNKAVVEAKVAKVMASKGFKVIKSTDVMPVIKQDESGKINKEALANTIRGNNCEALYVIAVKDIKTEKVYGKVDAPSEVPTHQIWDPVIEYTPMEFGYYGIYYNYMSDYQEQKYSVNEYALDRTYFMESNLYDVASEKLIWSIQSKAFNPEDLDSFFKGYSKLLQDQLKKEKLVIRK